MFPINCEADTRIKCSHATSKEKFLCCYYLLQLFLLQEEREWDPLLLSSPKMMHTIWQAANDRNSFASSIDSKLVSGNYTSATSSWYKLRRCRKNLFFLLLKQFWQIFSPVSSSFSMLGVKNQNHHPCRKYRKHIMASHKYYNF